jgi:hypothetical protein
MNVLHLDAAAELIIIPNCDFEGLHELQHDLLASPMQNTNYTFKHNSMRPVSSNLADASNSEMESSREIHTIHTFLTCKHLAVIRMQLELLRRGWWAANIIIQMPAND